MALFLSLHDKYSILELESKYMNINYMINTNEYLKLFVSTSIDAIDINSVEKLVRKMDTGNGTDDIMLGLSKLYDIFLPTEHMMRRLSLMHQNLSNTGNLHEFCVTCVYIAAMESLLNKLPEKIQKIKSESILQQSKIKKSLSCWF